MWEGGQFVQAVAYDVPSKQIVIDSVANDKSLVFRRRMQTTSDCGRASQQENLIWKSLMPVITKVRYASNKRRKLSLQFFIQMTSMSG